MRYYLIVLFFYCHTLFGQSYAQTYEKLNAEAMVHYSDGNIDKAIECSTSAVKKAEKKLGKEDLNYIVYLGNLALFHAKKGNFEIADNLYQQAIKSGLEKYTKKNKEIQIILYFYAEMKENLGLIDEAIYWYNEAIPEIGLTIGKTSPDYLFCTDKLAVLCEKKGDYHLAQIYYQESLENIGANKGKLNSLYTKKLNDVAEMHKLLGEYDTVEVMYLAALDYTRQGVGIEHEDYGFYLNNLGVLYMMMGRDEEALPVTIEALEKIKNTLGRDHSYYRVLADNLETLYIRLGKYNELLQFYVDQGKEKEALELLLLSITSKQKEEGYDPKKLLTYNINSLYWLLISGEDFEINTVFQGFKSTIFKLIMEGSVDKEHIEIDNEFCITLNYIASYYSALGYHNEALLIFERAKEISSKAHGKEHEFSLTSESGIAGIYVSIGQYEKALPIIKKAFEAQGHEGWMEEQEYCQKLMTLGNLYELMENKEKAIPLYKEAYKLIQPKIDHEIQDTGKINFIYDEYPDVLNILAGIHMDNNQLDSALQLFTDAVNYTEKHWNNTDQFYEIHNNLAALYYHLGDYEKSETSYLRALHSVEVLYGEEDERISGILTNLCDFYDRIGKTEESLAIAERSLANITHVINRDFAFLSEKQKEVYIRTYTEKWDYYQSLFWRNQNSYPAGSSQAYTIALASKGLILNSGIQMRESIQQSSDTVVVKTYNEWLELKSDIAKEYALPIPERSEELKSQEEKIEILENSLSRFSSSFAQNTAIGERTWKDIQNQLKENEVAIEFTSFHYYNKHWADSTQYVALLIRKNDVQPMFIPLCEQGQLDSLFEKGESSDANFVRRLYRGDEGTTMTIKSSNYGKKLYELIWKPLEKFLTEGNTIYFAPSGSLHQVAFAALRCSPDSLISDRYKLVQFSTTAMLLQESKYTETLPKDIALFGGIRFTLNDQELAILSKKNTNGLEVHNTRSLPEDLEHSRAGWNYLSGTLVEVKDIEALALKNKIPSKLYSESEGTEESFKNLSGINSPRVLHISTHGFFFPDPKDEKKEDLQIDATEKSVFRLSGNPLNRAGILFAGANTTWKGGKMPKGLDDGILTAYEASNVMLTNTQLVVLSACETGLGEIKGSEGVFGLQRAFKSSGTEYLMMSLWKVPDLETAEFMTYFYNDWFSGNTIQNAFYNTQQYMKLQYPDEPYKWAAFVLMR